MAVRRVQYLLLTAAAGAYYLASGEWLAFILLCAVVWLPVVSLLLSLPAIWCFRASPAGAGVLSQGEPGELWLKGSCFWPMPPFRGCLRVTHLGTGKQWRYDQHRGLDTTHCGGYRVNVEKVRVCDYLGLFSFPPRKTGEHTLVVRPGIVLAEDMIDPKGMLCSGWEPKPGGGFSENHEHRLYRPGDKLNQLHWKLSAKVGELIVREPMEQQTGAVLLTLSLRGTAQELDRKFGRLLYAGEALLQKELNFEIHALTGAGVQCIPVASSKQLEKAVDHLLCAPQASCEEDWEQQTRAAWHYHIGGEEDEA